MICLHFQICTHVFIVVVSYMISVPFSLMVEAPFIMLFKSFVKNQTPRSTLIKNGTSVVNKTSGINEILADNGTVDGIETSKVNGTSDVTEISSVNGTSNVIKTTFINGTMFYNETSNEIYKIFSFLTDNRVKNQKTL